MVSSGVSRVHELAKWAPLSVRIPSPVEKSKFKSSISAVGKVDAVDRSRHDATQPLLSATSPSSDENRNVRTPRSNDSNSTLSHVVSTQRSLRAAWHRPRPRGTSRPRNPHRAPRPKVHCSPIAALKRRSPLPMTLSPWCSADEFRLEKSVAGKVWFDLCTKRLSRFASRRQERRSGPED